LSAPDGGPRPKLDGRSCRGYHCAIVSKDGRRIGRPQPGCVPSPRRATLPRKVGAEAVGFGDRDHEPQIGGFAKGRKRPEQGSSWRWRPESNRRSRFCRRELALLGGSQADAIVLRYPGFRRASVLRRVWPYLAVSVRLVGIASAMRDCRSQAPILCDCGSLKWCR
jgi:hypothetical protein